MKSSTHRHLLRKERLKKTIRGTSERPRLYVYRSLRQMYAQIIDDNTGNVLVSDSSVGKELKNKNSNIACAKKIGECIAKKSLDAGIKKVVFDRGGWPYHGRIKALAESARKTGLDF